MTDPIFRRAWWFAGAGLAVWALLWIAPLPSDALPIPRLLMLAMLVVVPVGLALATTPGRDGRHSPLYLILHWSQPPAALLAAASFYLPEGIPAGLLAAPWLAFCGGVALFGLVRILPRGFGGLAETCIDVALLYLPVGGVWLILSRLGVPVMSFSSAIIALTAVHFHYAGFAAPIFAGMAGRQIAVSKSPTAPLFRLASVGVISGIALVALGITVSPLIEVAAAFVLAICLGIVSLVCFVLLPSLDRVAPRILIGLASAALIAGMVFAGIYALGEFTGAGWLVIPQMVRYHGMANAAGMILGLAGWGLLRPPSSLPAPGTPFSKFKSRGRVGPDFFQRIDAVPITDHPPTGLVDDLAEYDGPTFSAGRIHPAIRAFYEDTHHHVLLLRPAWHPAFRLAARLYKQLSKRVGQVNFPLRPERGGDRISSSILPLDENRDGRDRPRAWVRVYDTTGEAIYVAAYSTQCHDQRITMNIAFPLPGGNLTSILRLEPIAMGGDRAGVMLTTRHDPVSTGDEGIYFANAILPLRLPMNELIRVWTPDMPGAPDIQIDDTERSTVIARHEMYLFGIRFLVLDYAIRPAVGRS